MTNEALMQLEHQYVMQTYSRFPVCIARGEGARFYDFSGREYIDFSSGIGVNALGTGNPAWLAAVTQQAGTLAHCSNLFYSEPGVLLAQRLVERTGLKRVFFGNSGAEANEGMIKLARKYSYDRYGDGRSTIITLRGSFHGRTITTLKATGQDVFHNYFFPFTEGFAYAEANLTGGLEAAVTPDTCAIMLELIQGEGGVRPLEQAFVQRAAELCQERDLLLLIDEVQTGIGRTGTLFAFQQYGIEPDAVSFAKGIAGGLPMGGFLAGARAEDVLGPGTHASTFGANPVCCAAAGAVLDALTPEMLADVTRKGAALRETVLSWGSPRIRDARGLGLMIGLGVEGMSNRALAQELIEDGLLVLTAGTDTLRLLPPLTITDEELEKGLAILKKHLF